MRPSPLASLALMTWMLGLGHVRSARRADPPRDLCQNNAPGYPSAVQATRIYAEGAFAAIVTIGLVIDGDTWAGQASNLGSVCSDGTRLSTLGKGD